MAEITLKIPRPLGTRVDDRVRMLVGSENAADLASSTPAGGVVVQTQDLWGGGSVGGAASELGGFGFDEFGRHAFGFSGVGWGFGDGEFGHGAFGLNDAPRKVLTHNYRATDKCATLPVGVLFVDAAGNESAVDETIVQISDPPRGVRDLTADATANPNEAELSWTASPDV